MIHEDQLLEKNLILHSTNDSHYLANSIRHIFGVKVIKIVSILVTVNFVKDINPHKKTTYVLNSYKTSLDVDKKRVGGWERKKAK